MTQDDWFIKYILSDTGFDAQYRAVFVGLCPHLLSVHPETLVATLFKLENGVISGFNFCSSSQENVDLFRRIFEATIPGDADKGLVSRLLEKHLRAQQ